MPGKGQMYLLQYELTNNMNDINKKLHDKLEKDIIRVNLSNKFHKEQMMFWC